MKRKIHLTYIALLLAAASLVSLTSCEELAGIAKTLNSGLSSEEIVRGLKAALDTSSRESAASASKLDGYLKNELIKIPLPPEIVELQNFANNYNAEGILQQGLKLALTSFASSKFDELLVSINRAAEDGAKTAYPIFRNAIVNMTISDGLQILQGNDTSATHFLRTKTFEKLVTDFTPKVRNVVDAGQVSSLWAEIVPKYNVAAKAANMATDNQYNFKEGLDEDLSEYITREGLKGLFTLAGQEEAKIRKNPMGYASSIIQKVFGSPEARQRK